jgi:hypothetical protein
MLWVCWFLIACERWDTCLLGCGWRCCSVPSQGNFKPTRIRGSDSPACILATIPSHKQLLLYCQGLFRFISPENSRMSAPYTSFPSQDFRSPSCCRRCRDSRPPKRQRWERDSDRGPRWGAPKPWETQVAQQAAEEVRPEPFPGLARPDWPFWIRDLVPVLRGPGPANCCSTWQCCSSRLGLGWNTVCATRGAELALWHAFCWHWG